MKKKGFTRNLHSFLKDEQGKMSSRNILKVGMGMVGVLTAMGGSKAYADWYGGGWDTLVPSQTGSTYDDWTVGSHDNWSHSQYYYNY